MVRLGHEMGRDMDDISGGALKLLLDYDWAGNVRELENAIERAMITARGRELTEADFGFLARQDPAGAGWQAPGNMTLADSGEAGHHRHPAAPRRQHQGRRRLAGHRPFHSLRADSQTGPPRGEAKGCMD